MKSWNCHGQCYETFHMFSPGFIVSYLTFKSLPPLWFDFCVWCNTKVQFHSFASRYPVFPRPFVEETVLLSCNKITFVIFLYWWFGHRSWCSFWYLSGIESGEVGEHTSFLADVCEFSSRWVGKIFEDPLEGAVNGIWTGKKEPVCGV